MIPFLLTAQDSNQGEISRFKWTRTINYTKSDYHADIQNWSVTQAEDGIMYFANNEGLLSFDGTEWELFRHPDNLIIRSVAAGPGSRVYAGTYEDFGYWEKDPFGNMNYHSLGELVTDFDFHNQEIWKILVTGDSIWFQSFTVVFLFHQGKVKIIRSPGLITSFLCIHNDIYARITGRGLFRMGNGKFELVDDSPFFRDKMIRVILPWKEDQLLIATSVDGIFIYSGQGNIRPWRQTASDIMLDRVINRGLITPGGDYVFGTQLYGIYIFDRNGNFQFSVNQGNGLQNNTVLALYTDEQGHLWAGLDNGIDLVDPGSGISFFRDLQGKIGAVYSVLIYKDIFFAGTNKGLFYSPITKAEQQSITRFDFRLVPGSESQVWSLEKFGNQVFCGHNDGTYEVQRHDFKEISNVSGGYSIKSMIHDGEPYLIQSTYTDLVIYKSENGKWVFSHRIAEFNQPAEYVEADHLGNMWAGHKTRGLYRARLSQDLTRIDTMVYYSSRNGFASDFRIGVFKINNRVVFLNEGIFYTYDDLNDSIRPFEQLNRAVGAGERFHRVIHASGNDYWFVSDRALTLYRITADGASSINSYPFDLFNNRQIKNYENLRQINGNHSILCLDNGFALIPHADTNPGPSDILPTIKKVSATGGRKSRDLYLDQTGMSPQELPHQFNSLHFRFACPMYGTNLRYRVRLEGLDEDWKVLSIPALNYDRLPAGEYTLHFTSLDGSGNLSDEVSWSFHIESPWYWSNVSRILYGVTFLLILLLIRRYYSRRLTVQEETLKAEKEREIIKVRNEQLHSEISYKSKELANTTFNIIKKNELLMEIRHALDQELRTAGPDRRKSLGRIARLVDRNISNEEDWKVFESNFEQSHEEFLHRIRDKYDLLTPSDLKLCAYLRMNLSTKKIALLLGITVRGVENHRYRLRKKLQLEREANLTEFLMRF